MNKLLEGKVAVITGGGQGVGLGIAQEFVEQGAIVVVTGRRQATLDNAIAVLGPKSSGIVADVSKLAEMDAMFKAVMAKHGRLATVVANAITNANGPLGSISEEQFDRTFNTNAKGVLFSIQPALPPLPRGGTIVIIGSTASISPPPGNESLWWRKGCRAPHGSELDSGHQGLGCPDQHPQSRGCRHAFFEECSGTSFRSRQGRRCG
jgi:NAD(P)-dependent dehydrogenase (short-subunit alcohol dehydrogenase family)